MSTGTTKAPNLPVAPNDYSADYLNQLCNILRLYFNSLDNPGACAASTINFTMLPTQADLASLKVGDVYVDTSAFNVLKIKT
jgi:hypothetical protein